MQRLFHQLTNANTPKANKAIMEGLATTYMPLAESYVHTVFLSASKSFPQGLEYIGYERCSTAEEFNEITRTKNNKRTYDLALSNLYLVKYFFRFQDKDLPPKFLYLPYVLDGGIINLGGSCYHLSPILMDKVISPGINSIFVRLLRDKVNFERCYHSMVIGGRRETVQIVWSRIYRKSLEIRKVPLTTKANTCVVHYLLAKYGFEGMFQKFAGFVPIIGEDEINIDTYPKDKYVICESVQVRPKTCLGEFYSPTHIRIAVPKEHWNDFTQALIAGFYYTVDHFPNRVKPAFVNNQKLWMILLGHIIFSGIFGEGKLYEGIQEHFNSLDEYVDNIIIKKLEEINHSISDFYDLLALILRNFNDWVATAAESMISLYGKSLDVLYYALFDLTSAIFRTNFRLNKLATKKQLSQTEIIETMNRHLKMGAIYGLTRNNIAVSSVSYSGDNKYPKITSVIAQQQSTSGATRGRRTRTVVDATKRIHTSMIEAGSVLFLSKSNPTPAVRANMYMELDVNTGTIQPKQKFEHIRNRTESMLKGYVPDDLYADTTLPNLKPREP